MGYKQVLLIAIANCNEEECEGLFNLLMGENSKRVSDLPSTHGALHDVVKLECVANVTDEGNSKDVGGTLSNRIENKNFCSKCNIVLAKGGGCLKYKDKCEVAIRNRNKFS